jgi:predicted ATPase
MLAQLQTRPLDLLIKGAHDLPPQHRTLRHAIHQSYALLAEHERMLFRRLGVFVGGWSLEAMEVLCGFEQAPSSQLPVETLHALIVKSLVRVETTPTGERRFLMLETIREYDLEQLRSCDELAVAQERHSDYFLAFAERAKATRDTAPARLALEHLAVEHDNLRAALVNLDTHGCHRKLALLCANMAWFWWYRGYYERAVGQRRHCGRHPFA